MTVGVGLSARALKTGRPDATPCLNRACWDFICR